MRIFIISAVFPPEPVTSATNSADLAEEMVMRGHEVTVFAPFPNRPSGRLFNGFSRAWKSVEHKSGYKIVRCWHTLSKKSTFASRALENISFGLLSSWHIATEKPPDVVYINTWALLAQNLNSMILKLRDVPIVCSVQDIYPESLTAKGMLKADGWPARTVRFADRAHLKRCAVVTSISPVMVQHLVKDRRLNEERVRLIPNWMDASAFEPSLPRDGTFRQRHGIGPDVFLAVFAGSITGAAGVELYVRAAEKSRNRRDIRFMLVGDGSMRSKLQKDIISRGLSNIEVVHPLPADQVPEVQAAADVLLLSLSGNMSMSAAPSKQIAYMFSGRPTIASVSEENIVAKILTESESGFVLPPDDAASVADLLITLAEDRAILRRMGCNARQYAENNFSKHIVLPHLVDLLESVAVRHNE